MRKRIITTLLAGALALTALSAPVTSPSAAGSSERCPASAGVCYYRLPANIQEARNACYRAEGARLGVPQTSGAYIAWWNSATPAQRATWDRAFTACQDRHQLPGGKWAWDEMVFVGWER